MNIVYIHGNGATADSFNFIRGQLTGHNEIIMHYDSMNGFYNNLDDMLVQLEGVSDIFFVAHSLGGIYALHLASRLPDRVLGAVTLSTPYGGSEAAKFAKYVMPFTRVLLDIQPHSRPILEANGFQIRHPWWNIVSTAGHSPLMMASNDGVVTYDSMRFRTDMKLVDIASNHYEILLNSQAVAIIKQAIEEIETDVARQIVICA